MCVHTGRQYSASRDLASGVERPGGQRPFALHTMSSKQPERSQLFLPGMKSNHVDVSMHHQSEEERLANDLGLCWLFGAR